MELRREREKKREKSAKKEAKTTPEKEFFSKSNSERDSRSALYFTASELSLPKHWPYFTLCVLLYMPAQAQRVRVRERES